MDPKDINWNALLGHALTVAILGTLFKIAFDFSTARRSEGIRTSGAATLDALTKKRAVYGKLAIAMRAVVKAPGETASPSATGNLLDAYAEAYLWASDDVVSCCCVLLDVLKSIREGKDTNANTKGHQAIKDCMLAMRRDCGFEETTTAYQILAG